MTDENSNLSATDTAEASVVQAVATEVPAEVGTATTAPVLFSTDAGDEALASNPQVSDIHAAGQTLWARVHAWGAVIGDDLTAVKAKIEAVFAEIEQKL